MVARIDWRAVREAYEGRGAGTVAAVAARFGMNRRTLSRRAKRERWTHRPPVRAEADPPDPAGLMRSLQRATGALVRAAETRACGRGEAAVDEREVKALAALAAMLAKVFDHAAPGAGRTLGVPPDPGAAHAASEPADADLDFDDPRQCDALAALLERLVEGRAADPDPGDDGLDPAAARDLLAAVRPA
jgi:transposase-like protein